MTLGRPAKLIDMSIVYVYRSYFTLHDCKFNSLKLYNNRSVNIQFIEFMIFINMLIGQLCGHMKRHIHGLNFQLS